MVRRAGVGAVRLRHALFWSPRLFPSLLLRLCLLVVATFGSRPCGVSATEHVRAPLIVGLRAHHGGDTDQRSYNPAVPSLASPARGVPSLRSPTTPSGGGASLPAVEALALRQRGASVRTIVPDEDCLAAMGASLMDPRPRSEVIGAGVAQGRRIAFTRVV